MTPHHTKHQQVTACKNLQRAQETVRDRLGELGPLNRETLPLWEEALGLGHLTDELTGSLNHMEGEPGDLVPVCIDIAASAIRLANALALQHAELEVTHLSGRSRGGVA